MRTERLGAMGVAALLALAGCGSDEEAEVPEMAASGTAEVAVEAPPPPPGMPGPMHGGTVVAAGDYPVEVVAQDDGYVNAFVLEDAPPPGQTQITVHVPADDGEVHPVLLTWDPSESRYRGRLRRVRPVPGPVEVHLVVSGDTYQGRAPRVVVIGPSAPGAVVQVNRPSSPRVNVQVDRPQPPRVQVQVDHPAPPRPHVDVRVRHPGPPPAPNVVVHAPGPPRPNVVVHAPGPPRPAARVEVRHRGPDVRVHHDNGRHRGHRRGRGNPHGGGVRVRSPGHGGHGGARVRVRH